MSNRTSRSPLRISPAPFKPSRLSIPPSPFSPRTPLTPNLPFRNQSRQNDSTVYPQPAINAPPSPLSWVWSCHQCHRNYRLGVTRRCLDDGHEFCSGTTTIKNWRKSTNPRRIKKHRACGSEFDYSRWKAWGRWRRGGANNTTLNQFNNGPIVVSQIPGQGKKDCWNTCDYPSECRWGKNYGIHTPIETVFPTLQVSNSMPTLTTPVANTTFEGILKPENCKGLKKSLNHEKTTFWGALIASAERRKSVDSGQHTLSPLSTVAEEAEGAEQQGGEPMELDRDADGDVIMENFDSLVLEKPVAPFSSSPKISDMALPVSSLKSLISKRRYRRERASACLESQGNKDQAYSVVVDTTPPPPVELKSEERVGLILPQVLLEELEPLSRVRSRRR
ncbi:hypothetical protein PTT_17944 [Pyrenophora teres f. teres 0-1]|uniref:Uncharacterized protein n=1 Tax=Pyrenophora teres f. teres (strain 0-1) TaxID=861557 RepID=E3S5M3_PYRTT|nr:hypothetical protein PTT_17944 [Pyrenophora teres f. teres 0-1]